ncbi:hypothetical protein PHMEG_00033316 [Phytophthora megakarya]|uniref:Uncharacterized protein n=1 Tax=Phytophthora megakarya TaxID=4795 RepID=A0A225UUH0_9STRA|nr:hypothetical protein PHMEG_00033316 [Phytophthora megakarya]
MEAARLGHVDVLTYLLTKGASTHLTNFEGRTALHVAVNREELQSVKILLAFDANAELGDSNGQTPLMSAIKLGLVEMATVLINASPHCVEAIDKQGDSVLGIAVYNGQLEIVRLLLNSGVNLSLSTGGAPTPLMLAASKGYVEIMNLLLDKGADVDEKTWKGDTALTFAAEGGQVEAVEILLTRHTTVDSHGVNSAPLAIAAQRGHAEVIKLLLKHNVNVNAKDSDGDSALHEAVYSHSPDCARVLIQSEATELDVQNENGWTPLIAASQRDLVQIVNTLLHKKASVELRTKDGRSALHIAAEEGRVDVVCLLLQHGAEIDVVNKAKWTPLMMAANRGHRETIKFLVEKGASLTCKNQLGENAADVAKFNSRTDVLDLLQLENPEVTNASPSSKRQRTE